MVGSHMKSSELTAKHLASCSKPPLDANEGGGHSHSTRGWGFNILF